MQEYGSSLKIDFLLISLIVSTNRKKTRNKTILFPEDKKLVSTSWNEGLAKKYVTVKGKTASAGIS